MVDEVLRLTAKNNQSARDHRCLYQKPHTVMRAPSAALAQLVEHVIRNDGVRCSSHLSGTISQRPFTDVASVAFKPTNRHQAFRDNAECDFLDTVPA
jgi:hypothetical protein